jgi:hypothetical protein
MLIATFISWSLLVCSPESPERAWDKPECVSWMYQCLVKEYPKTKDEDFAFENCSESIPDFLLD